MKNIYVIFEREIISYFVSPLFYIISFLFLIVSGYYFVLYVDLSREAQVNGMLSQFLLLIVILCPLLTIKLISEEKRSGTIELLLTSPISTLEMVIGKYLSALFIYAVILGITLIYVFLMNIYSPVGVDMGVTFSCYLGLLLMGGSLIAIGLFASSLTQSQMIAGISGIMISIFFLLIDQFARGAEGTVKTVMEELSLLSKYVSFHNGTIELEHIIYYLLWIILFILFANKAVESHIWK